MINQANGIEQKRTNKPSLGLAAGGFIAGNIVNGVTNITPNFVNPSLASKMCSTVNNLSADEFKMAEKGINEALKNSGLAGKGYEIVKVTKENAEGLVDILASDMQKNAMLGPKFQMNKLAQDNVAAVLSGTNSFCMESVKKIIKPEKGLELLQFHEMGHAVLRNFTKYGQVIGKLRAPIAMLAAPIALVALIKNKKEPGEKPEGFLDKTTTFIKNNAGKLTFATFIPMLLDEGLATKIGYGFAKKLTNPELAKKALKGNMLGFSTYLVLAVTASLAAYLGVKVRDKIAQPELSAKK